MYVGIAILLDDRAAKTARKLMRELDAGYGTGLTFSHLVQHVSLKQSFPYDGDLKELENYFRELFSQLEPFEICIEKIEARQLDGKAIVWLKVRESAQLRALHERLCTELRDHFGVMPLGYDGVEWQFHSTIAIADVADDAMKQIMDRYHDRELHLEFTARKAVVFCSMNMNPESYLCFKPKRFSIGR